ncbi:hypothetical protein Tco_1040667 [Tanacetum coccineum]
MEKIFSRRHLGRDMDTLSLRLCLLGGSRGSFEVGVGAAEEGKVVYLVFQFYCGSVKSRIRLCTHAKRQGRERDSKNSVWPGPTNGKEGRGGMYLLWVPLIGDVRTLMMDEAHASRYLVKLNSQDLQVIVKQIEIPRGSGYNNMDFLTRLPKIKVVDSGGQNLLRALVDIAEGIENTAKTCVRLIILKRIDKAEVKESGLIRLSWYKRQPTGSLDLGGSLKR